MDHDQRFKELIREFFGDFLNLFFAEWAARFDLSSVEWLDKEMLPNPPDGTRHLLDLVARLRTRQGVASGDEQWLALIHIEIESPETSMQIKRRLPAYYVHLRDRYGLPVLPIVIYLKVGLDGIGVDLYEESFWELTMLQFRYLYVGLPGLDAIKYVEGDNWLGVALAALMKIPKEQIVQLGVEALQRLTTSPLTEQQRYQLAECVEAYLPLEEAEHRELIERINRGSSKELRHMNKTTYERGMETGIERGMETGIERGIETGQLKGMKMALLSFAEKKLGSPTPEFKRRLEESASAEVLIEAVKIAADAVSWDQIAQALR